MIIIESLPFAMHSSLAHGRRQRSPLAATTLGWAIPLIALCLLGFPLCARALGQPQYVENVSRPGSFPIVQDGTTAAIYVDTNDWAGVIRAAGDLQADVARVTGLSPAIGHEIKNPGKNVIIVGTIGKNETIDGLIHEKKIDVSQIAGKWESFLIQVVPDPLPGVANGLVIVGSDKRGTIYGIYDLSEEMGVSPWYWWADVPVRHQDALFVKAGKYEQGPPAVKYRGIFINDEAPDLTGWVKEKFGDYNHTFYTNVFELLLRLKANYLWPAMWNNCFNEDDPLNPKLADEYGIVMGTSHVEPMMRADKEWNRLGYTAEEWNYLTHSNLLDSFWKDGVERSKNYENVITIAMRGKIDTPMSETANISLLEEIVAAQRNIIAEVYHTNAAAVPQDWALYKEVQEYYEKGMRVPDDVTLLWCDDNWGDIRRLPSAESRKRAGGAGIYYHFDYVGGPRNYKWLNTNPTTKIWEQMDLAYHYDANQIWIVNVGHLKGYELPIDFFLSLAWNPEQWPKEKISEFTRLWAECQFGPEYASPIADILSKYTKYNGRRKPELLDPNTFSLVHYQEADKVLADWKAITAQAEGIYQYLPENERSAFFELVLYPTKACEQVNDLYITTAKNRLCASQGRASANDLAAQARALFNADAGLSDNYDHTLENGRWDHMMDQTHIGYTSWQEPRRNIMPKVTETEIPTNADMGVAIEGSSSAWPGAASEPVLPVFDVFNQPHRFIDIFNKGQTPFEFSAAAGAPWIELSSTHGTVKKEQRLWVSVDWSKAPNDSANSVVTITGPGTNVVTVKVDAFNPPEPTRNSLKGFVEAGGCVSIEAAHYTKKTDAGPVQWDEIPNLGRTLSAMTIFPVTAASVTPPENSPCLEYQMYLFHPGEVEVEAIIDPTLNFVQGRGLRFALSFDEQPLQIVTAVPENYTARDGNRDWETTVKDSVRKVKTTFTLANPGYHTLKFWMVDPGVVLQKIVVNTGGVKPSYLGPPESYRGGGPG
ncbi:MAG: glycosyl hydrolase 115 family protein [Verrucomicrobiota bacterium]